MFVVPVFTKVRQSLAFIASPFVPVEWKSYPDIGVCTSGIANAVAADLLRTTFHSGILFDIFFFISPIIFCLSSLV
jgi:hypothetical protein